MALPEKLYRWNWDFKSPPGVLWHLVSNTARFNRDCGFPPLEVRPPAVGDSPAEPGVRRLRAVYCGVTVEWEEREFEWVQPFRFSVSRAFTKGLFARMVLSCELSARPGGGTTMVYEVRVMPLNLPGALIVPYFIGVMMRRIAERAFRHYDELASVVPEVPERSSKPLVAGGARQRMASISAGLVSAARQPAPLVGRLCDFLTTADDLAVSKMRPYYLADAWGTGRIETLDLFLHATHAGLLDFSWDVRCPYCRASTGGKRSLSAVSGDARCESCGVDFAATFDRSLELTFVPNPSIRRAPRASYCMGGPQITPHIVAQKRLGPREDLYMATPFHADLYQVRARGLEAPRRFRIQSGGSPLIRIELGPGPSRADEPVVAPDGFLKVINTDAVRRLAVVERIKWSDQPVTAASVTSRQTFRELFPREAPRPGERMSVGSITIVFTDLRGSTQLYGDMGDAPAFGRVFSHLDTVKAAVSDEGGAIVKTMGDAVMAVFTGPAAALRAMRKAQASLPAPPKSQSPLALKCSVHQGPCLAVGQNDRLDYFGMTVNIARRMCSLSTGADIVISGAILRDPSVAALLENSQEGIKAKPDAAAPLGAGGSPVELWRVTGAAF